jgi:RNA polymerase sigma-70 factor, ECF subfamily
MPMRREAACSESFSWRDQSHAPEGADSVNSGEIGSGEEDFLLVQRVLAGDRSCFETLVRRHERRVFRVTLAVLGNMEDAEDAMQEAFIKAFRHLDQFRGDSRFTTWLTRIAVNEALQKRQKRKDLVPLDESRQGAEKPLPQSFEPWAADPEQLYGQQELRRLLETAIQALPPIYRETLVLRDVEGMSAEEAAEALGIKVTALKSRLLRARLLLRETLAGALEEPRPVGTKVVDGAVRMGNMVKMMLARAAGR